MCFYHPGCSTGMFAITSNTCLCVYNIIQCVCSHLSSGVDQTNRHTQSLKCQRFQIRFPFPEQNTSSAHTHTHTLTASTPLRNNLSLSHSTAFSFSSWSPRNMTRACQSELVPLHCVFIYALYGTSLPTAQSHLLFTPKFSPDSSSHKCNLEVSRTETTVVTRVERGDMTSQRRIPTSCHCHHVLMTSRGKHTEQQDRTAR
jgi:hypothetical protein